MLFLVRLGNDRVQELVRAGSGMIGLSGPRSILRKGSLWPKGLACSEHHAAVHSLPLEFRVLERNGHSPSNIEHPKCFFGVSQKVLGISEKKKTRMLSWAPSGGF